jgi:hypothetical protein
MAQLDVDGASDASPLAAHRTGPQKALGALGISHAKLKEVLHRDFADCSAVTGALSSQDAAFFCLGAYTGAVPDIELRRISVDYAIEFARVRTSSPKVSFSFLSGNGADTTGRSRISPPT